MSGYVFGAEPLVAYLYDEPGSDRVAELLDEVERGETSGAMSDATATEVMYLVARFETEGTPTERERMVGHRDVLAFDRSGVSIRRTPWETAARIKSDGDISLGDAYAAALAADRDATLVVGADDDFEELPIELDLLRFRESAV